MRPLFRQFDHNEFPGVVPRSFVGACMISIIISPLKLLANVFQFRTTTGEDKLWALFAGLCMVARFWSQIAHPPNFQV